MAEKLHSMKNICQHCKGSGGAPLYCEVLQQNCLHQHWCTNNRVFELWDSALQCKNFIRKEDKEKKQNKN